MFSVFKNINRLAGKSKLLDFFAIFCAEYLVYLLIVFLFFWATFTNNWQIFVYPVVSALFAAFAVGKFIHIFYRRKRPAFLENAKVLIHVPQNPSFPSRHASILFGISFYLLFYNFPLAIIFIVCSCLVGIARVFCGVHWFSDIATGAIVGFASSQLIYYLVNYL